MRTHLLLLPVVLACSGPPPAARPPQPLAVPPAAPVAAAERPALDLQPTRTLLQEVHREHLSSRRVFDAPPGSSANERLRAARPVRELDQLQRLGDPTITALGGTFYGLLVRDLGATAALAPGLVDWLHASEPQRRAFAAEALGNLGWADAVPHLQALTVDHTPVEGYSAGSEVATFANLALQQLAAAGKAGK